MSDDFPEPVKRILAARAGHLCSNPECRVFTSGPQEDQAKAVNVGVAAHITAASVGGPRFDPGLSPEQRSAPSNGIWLCQNCAKLVDNDVLRFSVTLLNGWKADAEEEAQARIGKSIILSPAKGDVFMDVSVWNEEASSWKRGEELLVRYSIEREKDRIVIRHNLGYLTLFKNGGPISPLEYVMSPTYCPFKWDFPFLDVKVLNNQSTPLFLNEVVLDVTESRIDLDPLFTIKRDTQRRQAGGLYLVNEGWCDITDLRFSFQLSPGSTESFGNVKPPFPYTTSVPNLVDYAEVDVTDAFQAAGADIHGLISLLNAEWMGGNCVVTNVVDGSKEALTHDEFNERWTRYLGPFGEEVGTLSGEINYATSNDEGRKVVTFNTPVYLSNKNRLGIPKPPSYKYETSLEDEGTNYQRRVQISHTLQPGEADRFTVKVAAAKSSVHNFQLTLHDVSGLTLQSTPIEMHCFVPRSRRRSIEQLLRPNPSEDRAKPNSNDVPSVRADVAQQEPSHDTGPQSCGGKHLCPSCQIVKPCAFGICGVAGELKCDSCLYVEEYGPKAAKIIEAAIGVAAKLHDATGRLMRFVVEDNAELWKTKDEARVWMNEASRALEELDTAINRVHLRLQARVQTRFRN